MRGAALLTVLLCAGCQCGRPKLIDAHGGSLQVTLTGVDPKATLFQVVTTLPNTPDRSLTAAITTLPLVTNLDELAKGQWDVQVAALDPNGLVLQSRDLGPQGIEDDETTELSVNLDQEVCDGKDNDGNGIVDDGITTQLCQQCTAGQLQYVNDDPRCGPIDCSSRDHSELRGDNTAAGAMKSCVALKYPAITSNRCVQVGQCIPANGNRCGDAVETSLISATVCHTIDACESGAPTVHVSPDGTPCGGGAVCQAGQCVTEADPVGCSDGTREGFLSQTQYPNIAACSGAWSVPGVTRANLVPTCMRVAGNSSANADGVGCAAADLCSSGWHVCSGAAEVAQQAPSGCADAVPPGTPDKSLLFIVSQASQMNTTCDTTGDNDVFGCGNLGIQLTADKNCGPLNRALASTQPQSCGYNEAEPQLGPYECKGGSDSHLHEGALVTKAGCPNDSCSYSGSPVGSSDKGGVLCCRD